MRVCSNLKKDGAFYKGGSGAYLQDSGLRLKTLAYLVCIGELCIDDLDLDAEEIAVLQKIKVMSETLCKTNKINKAVYISRILSDYDKEAQYNRQDILNSKAFGLTDDLAINLEPKDTLVFSDSVTGAKSYVITERTKQLYREILNVVATKAIYDVDEFARYLEITLCDLGDLQTTLYALVIRSILLSSGNTSEQVLRNIVVKVL